MRSNRLILLTFVGAVAIQPATADTVAYNTEPLDVVYDFINAQPQDAQGPDRPAVGGMMRYIPARGQLELRIDSLWSTPVLDDRYRTNYRVEESSQGARVRVVIPRFLPIVDASFLPEYRAELLSEPLPPGGFDTLYFDLIELQPL